MFSKSDKDAPIRRNHAEATEILNKPGRFVVICRYAGSTCIFTRDNGGAGYSAEEASELVTQIKAGKA